MGVDSGCFSYFIHYDVLLQNATAVLLQNSAVITNCEDLIKKGDSYCKMWCSSQNGLVYPPIMTDFFSLRRTPCNLRNFQSQHSDKKTVKFETETVTYRRPQIRNLVSENIKSVSSFNPFKENI